ncbi:uncharacterized protein METZ01_LOCUS153295, partial [marine metagenome]
MVGNVNIGFIPYSVITWPSSSITTPLPSS